MRIILKIRKCQEIKIDNIKVGDRVYCWKDLVMDEGDVAAVRGEIYTVTRVGLKSIFIQTKIDSEHGFTLRDVHSNPNRWFRKIVSVYEDKINS